jgi:hypothetical protein
VRAGGTPTPKTPFSGSRTRGLPGARRDLRRWVRFDPAGLPGVGPFTTAYLRRCSKAGKDGSDL